MNYILESEVVTFDSKRQVLKNAYVVVDEEKIAYVGSKNKLPKKFAHFPKIDTDGYLYPGLIDLHNHLPYNFLNIWPITKTFEDRYQWPRLAKYKTEIASPTKLLANSNAAELVKYAECKAMVAGVTSIDGYSRFNRSYAAWLLRNVEVEPFGKLEPKIYQSVLKIKNEEEFRTVDRKMNEGNAFIYHLAEGTSEALLAEYTDLENHGLIRDKLVGVHCTALNANNWRILGRKKVKLVWSPLSNLLLYGKTANVLSAKKNHVTISLGSDWSPTGSKNLLWEMKIADLYNKHALKKLFSDIELCEMVTLNPANAIGVADQIGSIKEGLFADLVIFDKVNKDPYRNLLECTEKSLRLSIIGGRPRYGNPGILRELGLPKFEKIKVDSLVKGIDVIEPGVDYGDITFQQVLSRLNKALTNPQETASELFNRLRKRKPGEEEPLRLIIEDETEEMDNKLELSSASTLESFLRSNFQSGKLPSLVLDSMTMHDDKDFFSSLEKNQNLPPYISDLREYLN